MTSCRQTLLSRDRSTTDVTTFKDDENFNPNAPVKFSTSRAAQWKVQYKARILHPETFADPDEDFRYTIYTYTCLFLALYAFIREGNEWDDEMAMPLGKRMLSLREYQMNNELKTAIANKDDTSEIKVELQKIAKMRKEYNYD